MMTQTYDNSTLRMKTGWSGIQAEPGQYEILSQQYQINTQVYIKM